MSLLRGKKNTKVKQQEKKTRILSLEILDKERIQGFPRRKFCQARKTQVYKKKTSQSHHEVAMKCEKCGTRMRLRYTDIKQEKPYLARKRYQCPQCLSGAVCFEERTEFEENDETSSDIGRIRRMVASLTKREKTELKQLLSPH